MKLVIIIGFLGTGKTSLLLKLAEKAQSLNKQTAILVNEVGEIGVDNQIMKQLGHNVWEMLGGCVCCSLAGDVIGTLEKIDREFQSDVVLLEPSGAADPKNLMNVLADYQGVPFESLTKVGLIDSLRVEMLMAVAGPLIDSTLTHADMILITKADIASEEELNLAREVALSHLSGESVFAINVREEISQEILERIFPWKD
ncbi:GTP-binding protein [Desulfatibacillum aliphaticivorans]|uniref:GTP-binding protein n=1 Tax=Desulfatibacillum aliphaticivorans TaxID=218208 RepID=UPI0003F7BCF3|nr:GTP-binding protein [Desulfatibacillum aliphaticivorans]